MDLQEFKDKYEHKKVEEYPNQVEQKPLVSVCVMTYQHVNYIKDCLEGILIQQTDFPFEILLGEDESTDGTREICLEYAKKYPNKIRLFLHHRENNIKINGNPTGRFNLLYSFFKAKGKYIALCEGDDYWTDPLKLQKQAEFMDENEDCNLSYHNTRVTSAEESKDDYIKQLKGTDSAKKFSLIEYINGNGLNVWTVTMMIRSKIISEIPDWFYKTPFGDLPLKLLCVYHGMIGYIPETMSVYREAVPGSWSEHHADINWISKHIHDRNYIYNLFDEYTQYRYHSAIKKTNKRWIRGNIMRVQQDKNRSKQLKLIRKYFLSLISITKSNLIIWFNFLFGYDVGMRVKSFVKSIFDLKFSA
jgi:glycosyltransferase involved in cell wall biosynthesis